MKITMIAALSIATAATTLPLAAIAHADKDFNFHSPSGNIFCDMHTGDDGDAQTTCIVTDQTWVSPPRSPDCAADQRWGDALSLYQGSASFQCYRQTPNYQGQILNYGQTLANGPITCDSEPAGMTCTDNNTGHFFRIARESYQLG
jgi:hypothetical protein